MSIGVIVTIYFCPIQHHFHLTKGKQNTKVVESHIPYTVLNANSFTVQRVYVCRQITFSSDSAQKAPDGACRTIGIQAKMEHSDVSAY